jgi:hypothetical protein
MFCIKTINAA